MVSLGFFVLFVCFLYFFILFLLAFYRTYTMIKLIVWTWNKELALENQNHMFEILFNIDKDLSKNFDLDS